MRIRGEAEQTGVATPLRYPARDRRILQAVLQLAAGLDRTSRNPTERAHEKHAYTADMPGSAAAVEPS